MGMFRAPGGGTVFNAATTAWGQGLNGAHADAHVQQITRNVLRRLSDSWPGGHWERIGHATRLRSMVACENTLFAADDANRLWIHDPIGQNVSWDHIGHANDVIALASPREATQHQPICLYAITTDHQLWRRTPALHDTEWRAIGDVPDVIALAASYLGLFAATASNELLYLPFEAIAPAARWNRIGHANNVVTMTNLNGRLFCVTDDGTLWTRPHTSTTRPGRRSATPPGNQPHSPDTPASSTSPPTTIDSTGATQHHEIARPPRTLRPRQRPPGSFDEAVGRTTPCA